VKQQRIYVDTSVLGGCFDPEFEQWSKQLTDQALLAKVATTAGEELARIVAVYKLEDTALLARIAQSDKDAGVRKAAARMLSERTPVDAEEVQRIRSAAGRIEGLLLRCGGCGNRERSQLDAVLDKNGNRGILCAPCVREYLPLLRPGSNRRFFMPFRLKRIGKWLATTVVVGVLAAALLLGLLWLEHNRSLELPRPTGPFAVGRVTASWVDEERADPFASPPGRPRELVVWLWYPADPDAPSTTADYLPGPWQRALAAHSGILLTHFLSRNPSKIRAHSSDDPPLAPDRLTYPIIILKSGIGALALDYTTIAEDLASHGYIVVGSDTPYSTSVVVQPDGRVIHKTTAGNPGDAPLPPAELERLLETLINVWSADTRFLVDRLARLNVNDPSGKFTGRLDLSALGVMGHSFGGATAAQFCHDDERCRAGMDIDGAPHGSVVREGLRQPFLFLLSDHGDSWKSPDCVVCEDIRSETGRKVEEVRGTTGCRRCRTVLK
jgi:predicted dienelactone hydrolase